MESEHKQFAEGLRRIADFYELHPEIPLPVMEISNFAVDTKEDAKAVAKALRTFSKSYSDYSFIITKSFGPIKLIFHFTREHVCTRTVVGVETEPARFVEAHTVPARTKEIVKWECEPVLGGEDA